jgi:hypothetical protein
VYDSPSDWTMRTGKEEDEEDEVDENGRIGDKKRVKSE